MKTYFLKHKDLNKKWLLIDADNLVLGRVASEVSKILRGKHKPSFTPHMDCGDNVVIVNAEKVLLTGRKMDRKDGKIYYRHTGFPGGIKETTAGKILEGKYPERVLKNAVRRMLPDGTLGKKQLKNLYLYCGTEHPHKAQSPKVYSLRDKNRKNYVD